MTTPIQRLQELGTPIAARTVGINFTLYVADLGDRLRLGVTNISSDDASFIVRKEPDLDWLIEQLNKLKERSE